MKRAILLAVGAVTAAAAAIPALVSAQGFPPPPPTTFYGKAPAGVSQGDVVIAVVVDGSSSQVCGDGITVADGGGSYVVDVVADAQVAGCGRTGRTVMFYFVGKKALSTDTAAWTGPGPALKDLTNLGPSVTARNTLPHVAKDGSN